jgi:hypothetical protein
MLFFNLKLKKNLIFENQEDKPAPKSILERKLAILQQRKLNLHDLE